MTIDLTYFLAPILLFIWAVKFGKFTFKFKIGNQSILLMIWKFLSAAMLLLTLWALYKHDYKYLDMFNKIFLYGIVPVMFLVLIETSVSGKKRK